MPQLIRKLSLLDTILLVIGSVIGSGIFMTTGIIAGHLPSPILILAAWIAGGFITICGALSFAELGAMFPRAGGPYVYIREAYGPWASFFYGWGFFWCIMCGGIAALGIAFAEYLGYFLPALSPQADLVKLEAFGISYSISTGQLVAVCAIFALSAINYFGIKSGIIVQNIFTFLRITAVAGIVILGLALGKKAGLSHYNQFFSGGINVSLDTLKFFGLALIAVLWTYDGWYSVNCAAEEIKRPGKYIPLGLILGTLSVTFIYILVNFVYLLALPVDHMKGVVRIGELASTQLFGPSITSVISATIMISIFGCLSASILYGPRVFYAMSEDGMFFRSMAYVHPRYHVPSKAIAGQAIWSAILCLSGTFQALFEYVIFALLIFFALTGISVIVLRYKQANKKRPYKVWGYPILPILFVLINLGIFFNTIIAQPLKSAIGLAMLLVGIPAFLYWNKKTKST